MSAKSRWPATGKPSKYLAVKTTTGDGLVFDSKLEARVWNDLRLREMAGEIHSLQRQVRYPLCAASPGKDVKVCDIVLDFQWVEHGQIVYADSKSRFTRTLPVWRLKKKWFRASYGAEIQELGV